MSNTIEDLDQEIQECLDTFQNAVFGEDVRSALIQAIEICYEKVVELAVTDDKIWEDIDWSLSFENPNNVFNTSQEFSTDFDNFPANGLFIERYYDVGYTDIEGSDLSKYRYFLAYIDSDADSSVTPSSPNWHRIIELTGLFESKQWQCQNIHNLPMGATTTKYYPSLNCMSQYVSEQLNNRLGTFDSFDLEQLQEDYADLDRRVTALENQ